MGAIQHILVSFLRARSRRSDIARRSNATIPERRLLVSLFADAVQKAVIDFGIFSQEFVVKLTFNSWRRVQTIGWSTALLGR